MDIKIREVEISDYEELCKIYGELDEQHRLNHPELFIKLEGYERAKEYITEIINDKDKAIFVAEIQCGIVGFSECYILKSSNFPVIKKREWIQLDNIAVRRDYQNCHIGSLLLKRVVEWAEFKQINRIELKVYSFNKNAIEFYEVKGFKELNRTMYLNL